MAVSPDGVLFVAERGADRVVALPDADQDGSADEVVEVGTDYGNAHDLEFTDDGALLVAGDEALFEVTLDGLREEQRRVLVDGLPTGGHSTKTVEVLPNGEILLSIGSSCDVCLEEDPRRASVQLLADDGLRPYMVGLRNAVGLWVDDATGRAWATTMGRDLLGDDRPPETVYELLSGADAGWPRCHAGTLHDPDFGDAADACDGVALPAVILPAHAAPLALVGWQDRLVIALHGSWNSSVEGRLRAVVAAMGWRARRRSRAVRNGLSARWRQRCQRPAGRPGGRHGRRPVRLGRQGRVRLPHHRSDADSGRVTLRTSPLATGPPQQAVRESGRVLPTTALGSKTRVLRRAPSGAGRTPCDDPAPRPTCRFTRCSSPQPSSADSRRRNNMARHTRRDGGPDALPRRASRSESGVAAPSGSSRR